MGVKASFTLLFKGLTSCQEPHLDPAGRQRPGRGGAAGAREEEAGSPLLFLDPPQTSPVPASEGSRTLTHTPSRLTQPEDLVATPWMPDYPGGPQLANQGNHIPRAGPPPQSVPMQTGSGT